MINEPLPSLPQWMHAFSQAPIPVLSDTVAELNELRFIEEASGNVDAHLLSQNLGGDPLLALKVLRRVSMDCMKRHVSPPETLTAAILMQGISPFFQFLDQVPSVADELAEYPDALEGVRKVIKRSRRAARFAVNFATHRQDEDAEMIQEAALLHDFAEILLWCNAPLLALNIARLQEADHTVRSRAIQQSVLGVRLSDLSQALMQAWHLPDLLIKMTDDRHASHPRVRTVMLAVRLARHTQYGWEDPHAQASLPDDIADLAELLNISPQATERKIVEFDG